MQRTLRRVIALFAVAVAGLSLTPAGAQDVELAAPDDAKSVAESPTGSYIVVLDGDPLVATVGAERLRSAVAERLGGAMEASHEDLLGSVGASASDKLQSYTNALNGFAATLTHDEANALANSAGVRMVMVDELRQVDTDSSREFLGLTSGGGAHEVGVTGEGVVVGVIDTGIWPEHPSFADDDMPAPPVTVTDVYDIDGNLVFYACDFGNTAHHPDDAPFECNNKLIGARQTLNTYRALIGAEAHEFDSARDDNGHGTHTASTAAGNADVEASIFGEELGEISGIAPDAHIIAYKGLGELGGFTSDLVSAIDQAVADGVDVINYSVGGGPGLDGSDAIAYLFAADAGVHVATSAGNSGPGAFTVGGPGDAPWVTTVGASTQERYFVGEVKLGNGEEYEGASITLEWDEETTIVNAAAAGGDLCIPGTLDPAVVEGNIVVCRRGAIARAAKSLAVYQAGGVGMVLYNNSDDDTLFTDTHWVPSVHMDLTPGLAVVDYVDNAEDPTAKIETGEVEEWDQAPNMAIFSSRGPNPSSSDIIKPDITAPGVQILAAGSPAVDPGSVPGELFMAIAGTSMSSPHVAGAMALMDQVHPDWSPAMVKSAMMTSSHQDVRDNDRVSQADPFDMGAGHLDPGRVNKKGSMFNPGLVYDAGFFEYLGFYCGADIGLVSAGTCGFLESIGVPTDESDLNLASIGIGELAGSQTVIRTVTSVADRTRTFRARVDAPDGYDVTVSPSRIRLAPGESATFEVTITNDGTGAVGEWAFGSMTWKSGGYEVYSPIAVRGSLIDAPASVGGSGTAGTASIPVNFGYSGAYSAAAHGLAAETVTSDVVVQDPDQSFNPGDGFSSAHTFDLTGSSFFRISLPPDSVALPDIDLDVFVFDPAGNFVAQSTAGGTSELIDIADPVDGVWTVFIHGWQTVGPDAAYDLSTWIVPDAASSLSVTAAPASATIGVPGTVDVEWAGLTAGGAYLGAVSHSDASGVIALTLVDVHS